MHEGISVRIMLVTAGQQSAGSVAALARAAARAGLDDLQVREKDLGGGALLALLQEVIHAVRDTAVRVFVNGRPDVALAAGAHGVQLPEDGLPVADVKRAFPSLLVGASRHSAKGALTAADDGADLVVLGPIFKTPGKEDAIGLGALAAASGLRIPVYAIGGVNAATAPAVKAAGARGVALIRPFLDGSAPETLAALREALE